jgi:hypothetical protein
MAGCVVEQSRLVSFFFCDLSKLWEQYRGDPNTGAEVRMYLVLHSALTMETLKQFKFHLSFSDSTPVSNVIDWTRRLAILSIFAEPELFSTILPHSILLNLDMYLRRLQDLLQ